MEAVSPEKLKGWRLRKGWTLQALADAMAASGHRISKAALGQFEKGQSRPKASTWRAIAGCLGIRGSELLESEFNLEFIGFRSLASLSETKKGRIKAEMIWHAERREKLVAISGSDRKPWSLPRYRIASIEESEEVANQVRQSWKIGNDAIGALADVIESHGGEVIEIRAEQEFSGLSAHSPEGRPYLAVQRRETDGARQRMDLAHELAHVLLDDSSPVDDEQFAHRFAGAFLLPREVVTTELGAIRRDLNLQELKALKLKYGISIQGWIRRAKDCGVIDERAYKNLCIRISGTGMRRDEGAPYVPPEQLDRNLRLAARSVTEGGMALVDAAALAGVNPAELAEPAIMKTPKKRQDLRNLTREERRKLAEDGARQTEAAYRESPRDLFPDLVDLIED